MQKGAKSKLEEQLAAQLDEEEIFYEREARFHLTRRWRFDFSLPRLMIAIEVEGGTYGKPVYCHKCKTPVRRRLKSGKMIMVRQGGRHNTGKGFLMDTEKYNEATILGWRVLRFASTSVRDGTAIKTIKKAIAEFSKEER